MKIVTTIFVTNLAGNDLYKAISFYENQAPNLGQYFRDSIISDLEALLFYAGIHEKHFRCYRMLAKGFPFSVYYQLEEATVVVYAILDDQRDPKMHKNRLKNT